MKTLPVLLLLVCACASFAQEAAPLLLSGPFGCESVIEFAVTTDSGKAKADSVMVYTSRITPREKTLDAETDGPTGSAFTAPSKRRAALPFETGPAGLRLLPSEGRLFVGDNMSNSCVLPQLCLPGKPAVPLAGRIGRLSGLKPEEVQRETASSRWEGEIKNPFSDTPLKTVNTLVSVKDGAAYISASSQKPAAGGGILTQAALDRIKKELGTRFALQYSSYEGTADVSYNAFFVFDTEKGLPVKAQENYYITGILRPGGKPISIEDAKEKDLYLTIAIKITHNISKQGD